MSYESSEAAYEAFFTNFNSEDPEGWAGVMSYPHTRVSAGGGPLTLFETPEDYAREVRPWERFKEVGWVRTEGIPPVRIHESDDKVHLAGGWSRYNAAGEIYISNRVTSILTKVSGSWGIQARFGTDSFEEGEDTGPSERGALDAVTRHLDAWDAQDFARCGALGRYPITEVGVGRVDHFAHRPDYEAALASQDWSATAEREVNAHQVGKTGVNVSVTATLEDGRREQALFIVALRHDVWSIAGRSRIAG